MGFTTVVDGNNQGKYAPKKYVRYTHREDEPKEYDFKLDKNKAIEGYYAGSVQRSTPHGMKYNHTLVTADNNHYVIPDNKDVTKAFLGERMVKGALTRFTYLGKTEFEYTKDDGSKGKAKAVKALIEQNKDDIKEFLGNEGGEYIKGTTPAWLAEAPTPAPAPKTEITADSIPF